MNKIAGYKVSIPHYFYTNRCCISGIKNTHISFNDNIIDHGYITVYITVYDILTY